MSNMKSSNGTSSYASDSENSDLDSKSNSSVSTVEDESRRTDDTETSTESNAIKPSALVKTLGRLPIVNDSFKTVTKFRFGRMTIDVAIKVSDLTNPVSYKYIEKADKMAAESVQRISRQFPLVKEPTDKIFQTVGCSIEDNITNPGARLVMRVDAQFAFFVDVFEDLLQRVVPDEDGKPRDIQDDQQLAQLSQTLRALHIALATRDRCVEKVKKQLTNTQSYTTVQLKQLQDSNQLLSRATETVNALNQTLSGMVGNLRETIQKPDLATTLHARLQNIAAVILGDVNNKDEDLPKTVQARIIELSSALMAATDSISAYIKLNAESFPEYLHERLKPLVDFFEQRYGDLANDIRSAEGSPLEKARNILQLTTNYTLPVLCATLSDLQESIHCYTNSLNTSLHNTTDAVFNRTTKILNVK